MRLKRTIYKVLNMNPLINNTPCWICGRTEQEVIDILGGTPSYHNNDGGLAEIYMENTIEIDLQTNRRESKYCPYVCEVCAQLITKAADDVANYVDSHSESYVSKEELKGVSKEIDKIING